MHRYISPFSLSLLDEVCASRKKKKATPLKFSSFSLISFSSLLTSFSFSFLLSLLSHPLSNKRTSGTRILYFPIYPFLFILTSPHPVLTCTSHLLTHSLFHIPSLNQQLATTTHISPTRQHLINASNHPTGRMCPRRRIDRPCPRSPCRRRCHSCRCRRRR
ncbi:MAG: hypothetical protein J3R72DRAFT_464001 [Linnemannia gamsii]|nr:MAG: hypothetical protein J3R72DRAFT_464001 [Linnemannia gamsii]